MHPTRQEISHATRHVDRRADRKRSYRDLEHVAVLLRRRLGLLLFERVDGLTAFDTLSSSWKHHTRGRIFTWSTSRVGLAQQNCNIVSPACSRALRREEPWAVFELMHAWGHFLLHRKQMCNCEQGEKKYSDGSRQAFGIAASMEWQAEAFAGAFLMPAEALTMVAQAQRRDPEPGEIAEIFCTPLTAARARLRAWTKRRDDLQMVGLVATDPALAEIDALPIFEQHGV